MAAPCNDNDPTEYYPEDFGAMVHAFTDKTRGHMTCRADKITIAEGERILRGILDGQEHYAWRRLRNRLMELPDMLPARAAVQVAVSFPTGDTRTA